MRPKQYKPRMPPTCTRGVERSEGSTGRAPFPALLPVVQGPEPEPQVLGTDCRVAVGGERREVLLVDLPLRADAHQASDLGDQKDLVGPRGPDAQVVNQIRLVCRSKRAEKEGEARAAGECSFPLLPGCRQRPHQGSRHPRSLEGARSVPRLLEGR